MGNELKFGNKVVFLNGLPFTLPMAATDPVSATNGDMYYNTAADQVKVYQGGAWTFLSSGSSVVAGTAGQLPIYPSNGSSLGPSYTQNSQSISVSIASQPSRSANLVYSLPNPGDAVTAANILLSQGAQTINGQQTFAGNLVLSALTASLPLQLDVSKNVVAAAINLASQVSGILPVANGGTNSGTALNNNRVIISSGGAIVEQAAITANSALVSDSNGLPIASSTSATQIGYLSTLTSDVQTQINSRVAKTGDTMTGDLQFSSTHGIQNSGSSSTMNIGTNGNSSTINIGSAGSTVNVLGTLTYVNTSTLEVANPTIILNEAGAAGSGNGAGMQINEGGTAPASIITASILVGNARNSWDHIAPLKAGTFRLTASSSLQVGEIAQAALTADRTWTMPDASGTVALISGSVGSAANNTLSNLGTTALNADILPSADNLRSVGSSSLQMAALWSYALSSAHALTLSTTANNGVVTVNANGTGTFDIEASKVRRSASGADSTNFMEDQYFDALTLSANISSAAEISSSLSFAVASFDSAVINYKIKEATSGKVRTGQFIVTSDGSVASSSDQFSETATLGSALGLVLSADISGGNVRILYNNTHATNACTMRCHIRRLRA